ncbi:Cbp3p NDAI_0F01530 [Naumovozyma dairenensis CBS 421]|uniref:Ubiquinol-cytochrome c chaperone domain-containing protein n=1 Tax=Naumovozyma dairenensis (strain ATCC 10597 / BCRC 20456 / CBS 421 / NBRC 0211 / NRRL Y-12639) TaxID=1071378 RepID=G0WCG1_NAUDC|nr:hypothetical protein NDAI_0F01530 [Naumovozyma dairenensis CBS 421]CCD25472.1 hypothetical protein NDAI_0F01530 [Naumovozyma dairenensis CBS 421]
MLKEILLKNRTSIIKGKGLGSLYNRPLQPDWLNCTLHKRLQSTRSISRDSPEGIVSKSHLKEPDQSIPTNAAVKQAAKLNPLAHSKYESKQYQLPKWKEALGEFVISKFNLDMDKIRAGPVAGSYFYNICKEQGLQFEDEPLSNSAKFFYEDLNLPRTFSQWFQITILHEWMLFVRMRAMPFKYGRNYQQKLVDRTFADIELRLFEEMKVNSGRIVDQYLKDFNSQLRGAVFAYDEGFFTDDATLATALWRNLFAGRKDIDMVHLEAMVRYVRSQLYVLNQLSDREFATGKFKFVPINETVEILTSNEEAVMKEKVIQHYENLDKNPNILPSERSKLSYTN